LLNLLHQRLSDLHLLLGQFMPPRHPGTDSGGRSKLLKTEVLASEEFVLGIEAFRPLARIVLRHLEIEIFDVLTHLAAEAASLVVRRTPDGENSTQEHPVGFDPKEALTEHDETRDVENSIGIQIMELNLVSKEKTPEERMRGKRKPSKEKSEQNYPEARRWPGYDFRAGGENLCRIILQEADLLGARQLPVADLGLDPMPNSGLVRIGGLGFFRGGTAGGTGRGRVPLAHGGGAQQELHRNGRWESCIAGAECKEEDDGGGVG
jgi:hypothetical protein